MSFSNTVVYDSVGEESDISFTASCNSTSEELLSGPSGSIEWKNG